MKRLAAAIALGITLSISAVHRAPADDVVICRDGKPVLPILAGSAAEPVEELRRCLERIAGARFEVERPAPGKAGLYVGLAADFPWAAFPDTEALGPEGFLMKSDGGSVFLVAAQLAGIRHAVTTFLHVLGCRWFFPGSVWEIIPTTKTIAGSWDERQAPSFADQRRIWYGFGAYPKNLADKEAWDRHNRMGGPLEAHIGHSWHGLDPKADFEQHPDWFALVDGKRQPSKPCYSHPDVIARAIKHALGQAAKGQRIISMSPPDGLGYCECEKCREVFGGVESFREHDTLFARRSDGVLVNITSETFFRMVNQVAEAVAKEHPDVLVGTYAYSAYSHPPSFDLHPNVFVQTSTSFRRTELSREEQLATFGKRARRLGIREYYSVYQWDWDNPDVVKGSLFLPKLVEDLRFYRANGVTAVNAEASNNWGPRGLGYYIAARLLWDVNADPKALIRDFYEKAFGPAAGVMERYYARWYGPFVAVSAGAANDRGQTNEAFEARLDKATLAASFRDLDEAARLVADLPGCRERVDHLRIYWHYLLLRLQVEKAGQGGDRDAIIGAIEAETVFGARLMLTNMIHSRPLIGKAFHRQFREYSKYLEGLPEGEGPAGAGKGFRAVREDVPLRDELERLWAEDKKALE